MRKEILDSQKAVAIEELVYREDWGMVMSGLNRMYHLVFDGYNLATQVYNSDNWSTEYNRLKNINIIQFGMAAYSTYGKVSQLWAEAQYAAAGEALINGLFPEHLPSEGNIEWSALPYQPAY